MDLFLGSMSVTAFHLLRQFVTSAPPQFVKCILFPPFVQTIPEQKRRRGNGDADAVDNWARLFGEGQDKSANNHRQYPYDDAAGDSSYQELPPPPPPVLPPPPSRYGGVARIGGSLKSDPIPAIPSQAPTKSDTPSQSSSNISLLHAQIRAHRRGRLRFLPRSCIVVLSKVESSLSQLDHDRCW